MLVTDHLSVNLALMALKEMVTHALILMSVLLQIRVMSPVNVKTFRLGTAVEGVRPVTVVTLHLVWE